MAPPRFHNSQESLLWTLHWQFHLMGRHFDIMSSTLQPQLQLCHTSKDWQKADPMEESDHLLKTRFDRSQSKPNALVPLSRQVFNLLEHAGKVFRNCEQKVLSISLASLTKVTLGSHQLPGDFPRCHDLEQCLKTAFLMLWLRITLRRLSSRAKIVRSTCGSKSAGMKAAVCQIR